MLNQTEKDAAWRKTKYGNRKAARANHKAKQAAAKLVKELTATEKAFNKTSKELDVLNAEINHVTRCYTQNGVHPDRIKNSRDERLVALMCPLDGCKETFPLKKRGDRGSANFAAYEIHLRTEHGIFLPKPADVMGW